MDDTHGASSAGRRGRRGEAGDKAGHAKIPKDRSASRSLPTLTAGDVAVA
jgi:hypothetical protein